MEATLQIFSPILARMGANFAVSPAEGNSGLVDGVPGMAHWTLQVTAPSGQTLELGISGTGSAFPGGFPDPESGLGLILADIAGVDEHADAAKWLAAMGVAGADEAVYLEARDRIIGISARFDAIFGEEALNELMSAYLEGAGAQPAVSPAP